VRATHPHPSPPLEGEGVFGAPALGIPATSEETLHISLFCYDTAPVGPWLDALAASPQVCVCYVPPGKPLAAVRAHLGGDGPWQLGRARIEPIPFLALDDYDRLLWHCDINFVRGEDSFVRAQWAGKPFIWQIYRQEEDAHLVKLAAFLDRCCPQGAWRRMHEAWNTGENLAAAWQDFMAERQVIATAAQAWRKRLAALPDLAASLVKFADKRL
ncbi:MAG: elongation factor P maturation arginine rhamnosyltransferase EarP, partial [Rhodocyclales bacterium]|nr:elongation factor P maturation arginine rhamnosyltransferase EarP [Rhodocyclales bacterium]